MALFANVDLIQSLRSERKRIRSADDDLIDDVKRILISDQYSEKKILDNIQFYNKSYEILDEESLDPNRIFSIEEIKNIAIKFRLRFLDSQVYKGTIPSEALNEITEIAQLQGKDLRSFKILAPISFFKLKEKSEADAILFTITNLGNYYLLFKWGQKTKWHRNIANFPLRNFENMFACILCFTLIITLSFPTSWITMDREAEYFSMYRIATFFHMLIFDSAIAAFVLFGFYSNFSISQWNNPAIHE
jgi:hypothetical protein